MKEPDVTIITSVYWTSDKDLAKLIRSIKRQKYSGKVTHILINDNIKRKIYFSGIKVVNHIKNMGIAATYNEGFRMAKTDLIVVSADDCFPASRFWLKTLLKPMSDKNVGVATSNVELPKNFWEKFSYFAKALTEKDQKVITPGLDNKGSAYKKEVVNEFGYLDDKYFKNGGEDTDLTVKIEQSKKWRLVNTKAKIYHYHHFTLKSRIKKDVQYARLSGLVSRRHFFILPWNFQAHVAVKILAFLFFIYSLINTNFIWLSLLLVVIVANIRLPFQIKRLGNNWRIVIVPLINIYTYMLYVFNYLYALIFTPRV